MNKTITDNGTYECNDGDILEIQGGCSPVITQSGGKIHTYNSSAPVITKFDAIKTIKNVMK